MSHAAVTWAWAADLPCAQRMVLMVLGDYFHPDQDACFPSQSTIAARAGLSRKHVSTCLGELELAGYISIFDRTRENGGNSTCSYVLHMPVEQARSERIDPDGHVYVAVVSGNAKIGITRHLENRMRGLQSSNAEPVTLFASFAMKMRQARQVEQVVLDAFSAVRITGEWLAAEPAAVVARIEAAIQDVAGGMSPEVTGGVSPEVTGPVTTGDMHNELVNLTIPPSPKEGLPPALPDVDPDPFGDVWKQYPEAAQGSRDAARSAFDRLSGEEQDALLRAMPKMVQALLRRSWKRGSTLPVLSVVIRGKWFTEYDLGPPIDEDGYFVLTPDRHEWPTWLNWIEREHGKDARKRTEANKRFLVETRYPNGTKR